MGKGNGGVRDDVETRSARDGRDEEEAGTDRETTSHNRTLGIRGEDAAARYLEKMGFEILERNWTCRFGEADIIAREDDDVVFVEVKTRYGIEKGIPEDAVDRKKRDRYEKIAASYLGEHDYVDCYVRFDVIGILVIEEGEGRGRALLRHHRSAFSQA